ncbi:MAG: ribonuclease domain-containing protein [Geminicoccaceae bacterium]
MRFLARSLAVVIMMMAGFAHAGTQELRNFAMLMGLRDIDGFVETVETVRDTGWLPTYYINKDEARDRGWYPGDDLCDSSPGSVIGGNRFGNREGRLPDRRGRRWTEADLDFDCGRRGARRLVFSNDGLIFVTVDHYETFYEVPE